MKPLFRTKYLSVHWGPRERGLGRKIICFRAMGLSLYFLVWSCLLCFTLCEEWKRGEWVKLVFAIWSNNFTIKKKCGITIVLGSMFWSISYFISVLHISNPEYKELLKWSIYSNTSLIPRNFNFLRASEFLTIRLKSKQKRPSRSPHLLFPSFALSVSYWESCFLEYYWVTHNSKKM